MLTFWAEEISERKPGEKAEPDAAKWQAVIALDMETWEELIELYDIREPLIKHRQEENRTGEGSRGWYA